MISLRFCDFLIQLPTYQTQISKFLVEGDSNVQKKFQMPHTFVIVSFIIVLMAGATWFIPVGKFTEVETVTYEVIQNNEKVEKTKDVPKKDSFVIEKDAEGNNIYGQKGIIDVLEAPFAGFVDHTAVEVIAFILLIGGAFGILIHTRAVEVTIIKVISKIKGGEILMIPVLMIIFSLGGAVFGMAEETIPFTMILIPIVIAAGYDSITAICIAFVASQIGFTTAFMNPFNLGIAQGIAGVPYMSGFSFRLCTWIVFTAVGIFYVMRYAMKVKNDPESSPTFAIDEEWRQNLQNDEGEEVTFHSGHLLIIVAFFACMLWLVYGVIVEGYYLKKISMIFMAVGAISGIIAVFYKMMTLNEVAHAFEKGAANLLTAAIIVAFAKGIVYVMGGSSPTQPSILNTCLYSVSNELQVFGATACTLFMYAFQSIFNFFVVSGSGQAALTMPLMAPLGEMVGVNKDIAVLAFQFGDGITNMIVPTSAVLIGVLSVAKVPWLVWAKWQIKMQLLFSAMCIVTLCIAVAINFGA